MTIGILYIVTGRYTVFWKDFYSSLREKFLPGIDKHIFLFSEQEGFFTPSPDITYIPIERLEWPYQTLLRYKTFADHADLWKDCDYVFFMNADYTFYKTVGPEILPGPDDGGLAAVEMQKSLDLKPEEYPYERNPESTAYIPVGQGEHYFSGAFNGGTGEAFLELSRAIVASTQEDLDRGIIAVWHDESQLNKYLLDKPCKVLPPIYLWHESWLNRETRKFAICGTRDKGRYGGHAWLRGQTDRKKMRKIHRKLLIYGSIAAFLALVAALLLGLR